MRDVKRPGGFAWWGPRDRARRQGFALVALAAVICGTYIVTAVGTGVAILRATDATPFDRSLIDIADVVLLAATGVALAITATGLAIAAVRRTPGAVVHRLDLRDPRPHERHAQDAVAEFALGNGIPPPRVLVVDDPVPNALVVGRPQAGTVVLTTGALALPRTEVEALSAHSVTKLAHPEVAYLTAASALLVWAARAAQLVLLAPVVALFSAVVGVPPSVAAGLALALVVVEIVTWPVLLAADRATIGLLDRAGSLADTESIRVSHQPAALASLLISLIENPDRVTSPWQVGHLWFERDGVWTDGPPPGSMLSGWSEPPRLVTKYRPTSQRPLRERAALVVELASGDSALRSRLARVVQRS